MLKKYIESELLSKLDALVHAHKTTYARMLRSTSCHSKFCMLLELIARKTPLLDADEYTLATRIYWTLNGIVSFDDIRCCCKNCHKNGKHRNVKNVFAGYNDYCSKKCMHESSQRKARYKQTCIKRFGCENASQNEEIKGKKAHAALEKYGVKNPAQSSIVKKRIEQTSLERYGARCSFQAESIKEKSKKTLLKNYGVEHPCQSRELRLKASQKYAFNGINFDSKPELAMYIYLLDSNADFEYQPDISFKYVYEGKTLHYFPDFRIGSSFYEIKGRHFFKEDGTMQNPWCHAQDGIYEAKHQCMTANGVNVLLDNDKLVMKAIAFVEEKYGKGHLSSFKKELKVY